MRSRSSRRSRGVVWEGMPDWQEVVVWGIRGKRIGSLRSNFLDVDWEAKYTSGKIWPKNTLAVALNGSPLSHTLIVIPTFSLDPINHNPRDDVMPPP